MIFLGSIGLSEDAFAVNLNGAAGCTALGGSFVGSTCTVDSSITISSLVVFNGFTLEVAEKRRSPSATDRCPRFSDEIACDHEEVVPCASPKIGLSGNECGGFLAVPG